MILEEETFKKFGYYPKDLTPGSDKRILVECDDCGKIRELYKYAYRDLCRLCANKGERCYNYGKSQSDKTKQKISDSLKGKYPSDETRDRLSKARKGEKSASWKGGETKCICLECGKTFYTKPSRIKKGKGKYCSRKCKGKASSKIMVGENSPRWEGGISFGKYCPKFNENFKQYIRNKFGNVCFLCSKTEEENGQRLSVHHVNYSKGCGCAETEKERVIDDKVCQFVPLCRSCHSKVHGDRDKWEKYFKNKLRNKLNGWYI